LVEPRRGAGNHLFTYFGRQSRREQPSVHGLGLMRTTAILALVIASVLIGSTPVSSLSELRDLHTVKTCWLAPTRTISLVGLQGTFGIVVSHACSQ
jgi:hypothetical protein